MTKLTLQFLADGIEQVNRAFIENPQLDKDEYPPMVVQYLMSALLIALGQSANDPSTISGCDFGFYQNPGEVGYTGWLTIGEETLFFGPTKVVILPQGEIGLSPYGELQ